MEPRKLPPWLPADWPDYAEIPTWEEWQVAMEEDRTAEAFLAALAAIDKASEPRK
ncbi:hypothetical protein [Rhizobacter sp. Root404]|uniref:hypothetical protein n=1 Tax=Rhizobacter sp. Root404 TaxID=1736528 RepID=UPI0012FA37F2|nr:hypothetical protein [Rhizobacter sp. Root404]